MSLVRVRSAGQEFSVGEAHAIAHDLEVLEEAPCFRDGSPKPVTRLEGRPKSRKSRVPIADAVEKMAAKTAATPTSNDSEE